MAVSRSHLRNGLILARVLVHQASDDPIHLIIQGSRRVPRALTRRVGGMLRLLPGDASQALAAFLSGEMGRVRHLCGEGLKAESAVGPLTRRVLAEIALEAGGLQLSPESLPPSTAARACWKRGEMSQALAVLELAGRGRSGLARRLRGEALSMDAAYTVPLPELTTRGGAHGAEGRAGGQEMRAFHVLTNSLPHTQSGYTLRTHRLLSALVSRGVRTLAVTRIGYPVLVGIPWGEDVQRIGGVEYRRVLPLGFGGDLPQRLERQTRAMAAMVREFCPRVLHCTTNYANALMTDALARAFGLPWVYEVRGLLEETWASGQADDGARAAARASERFTRLRSQETRMMERADHVITLSEVMRREIIARGIPAEKVSVVPNAVAEGLFGPRRDSAEARQRQGLPRQGFWVGSISSLVEYEGFDLLLRAVALTRSQGHDVRVLLVGEGAARAVLEMLAGELGLEDVVVFTGRVAPEQARGFHECLDLFTVPRADVPVARMVTPLKPIEAMAVGTPVLMSDLPPLRELAEGAFEQGDEHLVSPGQISAWADALGAAAAGRFGERAARAGRIFAAARTWEVNAERVERIYGEVASVHHQQKPWRCP